MLPQLLLKLSLLILMTSSSTSAIFCYECDSSNNFSCTEFWDATLLINEQVRIQQARS